VEILAGGLWVVLEIMFALNVVIGENVVRVFKWLQNNADALKCLKMKRVNGKKYLVRKSIPVKRNVRKCEIVESTPATENVALAIVHLVSSLAISNFLVKITSVLHDVTHRVVILVTKQKKFLVFVAIQDILSLVVWNVLRNLQSVEQNVKHRQIVTMQLESHILVILDHVLHVVRPVIKH
jgi:hypothetical protein